MSDCVVAKTNDHDVSMDMSNDKTLFEPTVEMMVNDFDDERTLDEEEALAAGERQDPRAELSNLRKEGDMPLEELLALYGLDQRREMRPRGAASPGAEDKPDPSALRRLYAEPGIAEPPRFLRSVSRPPSEEEEDYDYSPEEEDWKKTIMVGGDYQAWIPDGLCSYDDALPYENDDKLLWDPEALDEGETERYMARVRELAPEAQGLDAVPTGPQLRDDEQALFLLQQCGHNVEEALRRRRLARAPSSPAPPPPLALWSEEECRNFENGLKAHGKDFHLIHQHKVRTRSVGELVQFYYIWKKTERHDMFANKARLEKKKYTLHPGHTDYMDRFLEEQEESPAPPAPPPDPLAVGREVFSEMPARSPSPAPSHSADDTDQESAPPL